MSGPKRNPDKLNTIGIVVVGICGAVLVYVSIVALQAFYMEDTAGVQTMADYGGQEQPAAGHKADELRNITEVGKNPNGTYHFKIDDAMQEIVRDAAKDPSHLVPALPPSTKPTIEPTYGRPQPLGGGAAPAAPGLLRVLLRALRRRALRLVRQLVEGMATDRKRGHRPGLLGLVCLIVAVAATPALAHPGGGDADDSVPTPPPTYKGNDVQVDEHLGAKVPLDAQFITSDGKPVTLGELLKGDLPTILTFNYSDCPMLCSLQLNGLSKVLPELTNKVDGFSLYLGAHFRIVTIDLEPNEPLEKLAKMKAKYIDRLPAWQHDQGAAGWTFLRAAKQGDGAAIRRVADTVGFKYTYLPDRAEWAHPAALIFLATSGAVTRYVYGIDFAPAMMRESLILAGKAESATAVGFLNRCYHYDPEANSHARAGVLALRLGAAGFVVLLAATLALMHFLRKNR